MANRLKMAFIEAIRRLNKRGWSRRRIARELGVDRETVSRHLAQVATDPNAANAPIGSEGGLDDSNAAKAPIGSKKGK